MGNHDIHLSRARARIAARHKLFEPVTLRLTDGPVRAHMLDLSTAGALVHCDRPPAAGARLMVEAEAFVAAAHVVWVRAKRFGIRFDANITDMLVSRALSTGAAPS